MERNMRLAAANVSRRNTPSLLIQLAMTALMGALGLGAIELYIDRLSWPVADDWYRIEETPSGDILFTCQRFRPVKFAAQPAPNTRRIMALGGSTTFGYPERRRGTEPLRGDGEAGVIAVLQSSLDATWPGAFELVNLGVNGGNSEDTLRLLRKAADWGASGLLVYDGHNEFMTAPQRFSSTLWRFSLYRRFSVLMARAKFSPGWVGAAAHGGPTHAQAVLDEMARNLDSVARIADSAGIPLVLSTQVSNLAGFDPNWSTAGDPATLAAMGDLSTEELEAAWRETPDSADLAWAVGQRRLETGGDATAALRSAADSDGLPFRATSEINQTIREVAWDWGAVLVDAEAAVRGSGPPDPERFYDAVHPRPQATHTLAAAFLAAMVNANMLFEEEALDVTLPPPPPQDAQVESALRIARSWVQWSGVRQHDPQHRLKQAARFADMVLALEPEHEEAQAIRELAVALQSGSETPPDISPEIAERLSQLNPDAARLLEPIVGTSSTEG